MQITINRDDALTVLLALTTTYQATAKNAHEHRNLTLIKLEAIYDSLLEQMRPELTPFETLAAQTTFAVAKAQANNAR